VSFLPVGDAFAAVRYSVTDLGTLGGDFNFFFVGSTATAINNSGQIVGISSTPNAAQRGFLYDNGTIHDLGTLYPDPSGFSIATAINEVGQVTGFSNGPSLATPFFRGFVFQNNSLTGSVSHIISNFGNNTIQTRGLVYENGVYTELGTLGGDLSIGIDINNNGLVTGHSDVSAGVRHAFTWQNGAFTDLGTLGGVNSYGAAINDLGHVVGGAETSDGIRHAYVSMNGAMIDIGPSSLFSTANAINNLDQAVGVENPGFFGGRAFVYSGGVSTYLDDLINPLSGWNITGANGINDRGQIVGSGILNGFVTPFGLFGEPRAILLTPLTGVPEPVTWALMIMGFGLIGASARRRRAVSAVAV
jgi:probable HAF family extracellular repeat protein